MPQMAPIMWVLIFMSLIVVFTLVNCFIYFYSKGDFSTKLTLDEYHCKGLNMMW